MITPAVRRLMLATHLMTSLGWIGAVLVFLALAVIALTTENAVVVRGAYLLMAPAAWFVLVPLAHASLISGIVLSLGTTWGLFKNYWVALKLALTCFATVVLLIYMGTFRQMAGVAADPVVDIDAVRNASPVLHSMLALILLMVATVLGVYKPFGMTPHARRAYQDRRSSASQATALVGNAASTSFSSWLVAALMLAILIAFAVLHLLGAGIHH